MLKIKKEIIRVNDFDSKTDIEFKGPYKQRKDVDSKELEFCWDVNIYQYQVHGDEYVDLGFSMTLEQLRNLSCFIRKLEIAATDAMFVKAELE